MPTALDLARLTALSALPNNVQFLIRVNGTQLAVSTLAAVQTAIAVGQGGGVLTMVPVAGPSGTSRTIVLPVNAGTSLDGMAWPTMDLLDVLPATIDATAYLAALGLTVVSGAVDCDPSLLRINRFQATEVGLVTMRIAPLAMSAAGAAVQVLLTLSNGFALNLVVVQPVEDRTPAGLTLVGTISTFSTALYVII